MDPEDWQIAGTLATQRIIVLRASPTGGATAEFVHDSLVKQWPTLADHLEEHRDFLEWRDDVRRRLKSWDDTDHEPSQLLGGRHLWLGLELLRQPACDVSERERKYLLVSQQRQQAVRHFAGHVFISYVREDSRNVDQLQRLLEVAGIPVWRDTADLWPGEDWRVKIRRAIMDNALVFLACFSVASLARGRSFQNEELVLAIEQLRLRRPEDPWLIPIRFDECEIPDRDIGGGRSLTSIQRADLFGEHYAEDAERIITAILRILGRNSDVADNSSPADRYNSR